MTIETGIIVVLALLLLIQQGFYMWQTHRLVNKLMSRNYAEYAQVNHVYGPKRVEGSVQLPDDEDVSRVSELNKMMGLI